MNLSCLFGHSYSEPKDKTLLILRNPKTYRYTKYKAIAKKCKVCENIIVIRGNKKIEFDNRSYSLEILKNDLILKIEDKGEFSRFLTDYNDMNNTKYTEKDFDYV